MMNAVHCINKPLSPFALHDHMKHVAMHEVLKKAPEQNTGNKDLSFSTGRHTFSSGAIMEHVNNNREIDKIHDDRMSLRHHLQEAIFK